MKTTTLITYISLAIGIAGCAADPDKKNTTGNTDASLPKDSVTVMTLKKDMLSTQIQLPGELKAYQQVDLYAKVNSFVKKLYVDVGSHVKEGQVLAAMEAPEIASQLSGAESRLQAMEAVYTASKANYDRLLETSKTPGTISPNDLDMALARQKSDYAQWQSAKAAYKEISDNRNYLTIRAPFSGIISARNVSAGAYAGPSGKGSEQPLFTLQEQGRLRLSVPIPEAYVNYLSDKSTALFTVRSLPNQQFVAKLNRRSGALDARLRAERVEMDVINKNKVLLPGMVAEMIIQLPAKDSVFIVPKTAVANSPEKVFVIKISGGKAQWTQVRSGRESDGKTEIYGALSEGDTLAVLANEEIRDGARIEHIRW
ncbi:MAG: efflux RND transporter periplasmic adaptor subunit [Chitinophagaceae bacterium]|nr:efflux RND transporter periplasmic adaptor subunit [Chitinophagaceae bacterium]